MKTKTFSVKDGTLRIHQDDIRLYSSMHDENGRSIIASTDINDVVNYGLFNLPPTLIRKPKTDEELALIKYPKRIKRKGVSLHSSFIEYDENEDYRNIWLAGRKSVKGDFHLTREELEDMIDELLLYSPNIHDAITNESTDWNGSTLLDLVVDKLTPPIYPHTIEVKYDGEKYYWENLKASYE
jgi:hypothetical protein